MHEECHISITGEKSSENRSFISQHAIAQLGETQTSTLARRR